MNDGCAQFPQDFSQSLHKCSGSRDFKIQHRTSTSSTDLFGRIFLGFISWTVGVNGISFPQGESVYKSHIRACNLSRFLSNIYGNSGSGISGKNRGNLWRLFYLISTIPIELQWNRRKRDNNFHLSKPLAGEQLWGFRVGVCLDRIMISIRSVRSGGSDNIPLEIPTMRTQICPLQPELRNSCPAGASSFTPILFRGQLCRPASQPRLTVPISLGPLSVAMTYPTKGNIQIRSGTKGAGKSVVDLYLVAWYLEDWACYF